MDTLTLLLDLLGALCRTTSHEFYVPVFAVGFFLACLALVRRMAHLV